MCPQMDPSCGTTAAQPTNTEVKTSAHHKTTTELQLLSHKAKDGQADKKSEPKPEGNFKKRCHTFNQLCWLTNITFNYKHSVFHQI